MQEYYVEIWTKHPETFVEYLYTTNVKLTNSAKEALDWAYDYYQYIQGVTIRNIRKI